MKNKIKHQVKYTDDLGDAGEFEGARLLTREEEKALGLPMPGEAKKMPIVHRTARGTRINVRLGEDTLDALKSVAFRLGMPYQTLAASVLHMVANGEIHLAFLHTPPVTPKKRSTIKR